MPNNSEFHLEAALANGHVGALPLSVKNLLALHSLKVRWATIYVPSSNDTNELMRESMGYRVYRVNASAQYVQVAAGLGTDEWIRAVQLWERLYGTRL